MFSERIAINNLFATRTIEAADEAFRRSCEVCCNSPQCLWRDCDNCRVAEMHKCVILELKRGIGHEEEQ